MNELEACTSNTLQLKKKHNDMQEKMELLEYQNVLFLSTLEQKQSNDNALRSSLHHVRQEMDALKNENKDALKKIV